MTSNNNDPQTRTMPGGYRETTGMEDEYPATRTAAQFAIDQLKEGKSSQSYSFASEIADGNNDTLAFKIVHAQQQVVAGMNYRLVLLLYRNEEEGSSGDAAPPLASCVGAFAVVVYDRFGTSRSVTQWAEQVDTERALAVLKKEQTDNFMDLFQTTKDA